MLKSEYSIGIIMSTYNGEKYILEQLNSIYTQTISPSRVYIRDDGSTDNTVSIIKDFIKQHDLTTWDFSSNQVNIGWRKNFMTLLEKTNEDVIFYSDQDDIWNANKLKIMSGIMSNENEIKCLFSDYEIFGESGGNEKNMSFSEVKIDKRIAKVTLNLNNLLIKRDGMAFAVKKSLIPEIVKVYKTVDKDIFGLPQSHDLATWLASILIEGLYHTNEKLVRHRIHSTSAWSKESKDIKQSQIEQTKNILYFYSKVKIEGSNNIHLMRLVDVKIRDLKLEEKLLESASLVKCLLSVRQFSSIKRYFGFLKRKFEI